MKSIVVWDILIYISKTDPITHRLWLGVNWFLKNPVPVDSSRWGKNFLHLSVGKDFYHLLQVVRSYMFLYLFFFESRSPAERRGVDWNALLRGCEERPLRGAYGKPMQTLMQLIKSFFDVYHLGISIWYAADVLFNISPWSNVWRFL